MGAHINAGLVPAQPSGEGRATAGRMTVALCGSYSCGSATGKEEWGRGARPFKGEIIVGRDLLEI